MTLGLHDLPIYSGSKRQKIEMLVRKKFIMKGKEYIFEIEMIHLLFFIQRLRDEAHRFAISTHRAKRKKES